MEKDFKLANSKVNYWKDITLQTLNSNRNNERKFKISQFNVKIFWERISLFEKEKCLLISNSSCINLLNTYLGLLECNYFQVFLFLLSIYI